MTKLTKFQKSVKDAIEILSKSNEIPTSAGDVYDYRDAMYWDILDYLNDCIEFLDEVEDLEELRERFNEQCWTSDSVTGNGSGSYTFDTWKAEENLSHNLVLLQEACNEFGTTPELDNPEGCDVTIRLYLLPEMVDKVCEDLETNMEGIAESKEKEAKATA